MCLGHYTVPWIKRVLFIERLKLLLKDKVSLYFLLKYKIKQRRFISQTHDEIYYPYSWKYNFPFPLPLYPKRESPAIIRTDFNTRKYNFS